MAGIPIASGFLLGSQQPVDLRTVVDTYTDLQNIPIIQRYIGLLVYVRNLKQFYYIKEDINVWELFEGGTGGNVSGLYTSQDASTIQVGGINVGFKPKPTGISLEKLWYLALHAGSTDIVKPPIITQNTIDGQSDISTTLEYITYDISNMINTELDDITKVESIPSGIIKDVKLIGNQLYVYLNPMNTGKIYDIKINPNLISNNGDGELSFGQSFNNSIITTTFETQWLPYPISPIVLQSNINNAVDQPLTLNKITFPVDNAINLTLENGNIITSSPTNIFSSVSLVGNTIEVYLHNLANLTQYTLTLPPNIVANNGDNITTAREKYNENSISATFKTIAPNVTSPVIGQSALNSTTEVNIYTTEITFPVTNAISLSLVDGSKVTAISSTGSSISIGNATLSGNVLHIPILTSKLDYSASYQITVQPGIVMNTGNGITQLETALNTNSVTASFSTTTKPKPIIPQVNQSGINNTTIVSVHLAEITFPYTNDFNILLNDTTKVSSNHSGILGTPILDTVNKLIHIPIVNTLKYYENYTISIMSGLISNSGDNIDTFGTSVNASTVTASFWTEPTTVTQPVVQPSSINGLSNQSRTLTEVTFLISNPIGTTILDISKIICDHAVIGIPYISSNTLHVPISTTFDYLTTYNITVGANAIQNVGNGISALGTNPNSNSVTCSFTTVDRPIVSAPTILQSALNNATNQLTSLAEITFNVSNGVNLILKDGLKVSSTPTGIVGTAYLIANTIHVPLMNLNSGTTYNVSILAGIVQNSGDGITTSGSTQNSNSITATFKTLAGNVSAPTIQNSIINGNTNKEPSLPEIIFPVSNCIGTTLKDGSRVTISPSGSVGIATFDSSSSNIHVPLSGLTYNTTYSVTVLDSVVTNHGNGVDSSGVADNTNSVTANFTTRPKMSAPVLAAPSTSSYPSNTTQLIYSINQSGCSVIDASKISIVGANMGTVIISGTQLIIAIGSLVQGNTVTVHVLDGAIANGDGVGNMALVDYTFSVTAPVTPLPSHDWEMTWDWTVGILSMNLTSVTGYAPESPLNTTNYTAQKIQVYFLGVKADLDSGVPEKNEKIYNRDFENTGADQQFVGKWYMSSPNIVKFTKSPTTTIRLKMIRLT